MNRPILRLKRARPTGRDADPRRTIPLNTSRWQRMRAAVLAEQPLCVDCLMRGHVTPATDVDHDDGDPGNNARSNLVSRCHSCHSTKTMRERNGSTTHGCDVDGMPLDPAHPWNRNRQQPTATDRAPPVASSLTER